MDTIPTDPLISMSVIAELCSDLGLHDRALAIFERLAALRERTPNALVPWAIAQSRAGDQMAAQQTLRRALMADPEHDMARVVLAVLLHETRDPEAPLLLRAVLTRHRDAQGPDAASFALALAESVKAEILQAATPAERVTRLRYTRVDAGSTP